MGCLIELFFEVIVECVIELVGYCYIKLMQLIVPNKIISEKAKKIIKTTVTTIAALLAIVLIIGLILFMQEEPFAKTLGKYMTYIPLAIIVLQVILGILVQIVSLFKK